MTILTPGTVNPNALVAPGVYISPQLPSPPLNGVATNIILVVGTATWGAINSPVIINSLQDYTSSFGNPQTTIYDMGTQVMAASSLGGNAFVCVRVTDGTDVKATVDVVDTTSPTPVNGLVLTALYSGTLGNTIQVVVEQGTNYTVGTPVYKISILFPTGGVNNLPEVYDNIGGTGATFWQNAVNAINLGQGALSPPSQLVTAAIGTSTATPALQSYVLAGGTDGNSGVTDSDLVGSNISPRTGMYSASGSTFDLMVLSNVTTGSTYQEQISFAEMKAAYVMLARPQGESFTAGIAAKKAITFDVETMSWGKLMVGDWCYFQDNYNNTQRYMSPQAWIAGILSNLSPEQSSLNKILSSAIFLGTQTSVANKRYNQADIAQILQNGLDVIALPSPGGFYFGAQTGKNLSSNLLINGDEYTRNTNYLAATLNTQLGVYVGELMSPSEIQSVTIFIKSFLYTLWKQNKIGSTTNPTQVPYTVSIDVSQAAKGIQIANVTVAFLRVIVVFLVNLQTGVVSISSVTNQ